ncbi:MAG: KEOPS complex subunit Cgi121 [Candidatus Thermoplasmatota archaeon]|nr:KEOPS complex subunit Cgi121 [Candidatus Thermoplasmatota archaeon]
MIDMMEIVGAKGNIQDIDNFLKEIESFAKNHNIIIQAFDADMIFGKNHLISSVNHAVRSIDRKTNTTNSLEMEILLYSSGERQLKLAIPKMGVKDGETRAAFVFVGDKVPKQLIDDFLSLFSLSQDDKLLEGDENTLKKFGINEDEIKTVTKDKYGDLILEKVAMVDIIK